jgi:hypothetical protein
MPDANTGKGKVEFWKQITSKLGHGLMHIKNHQVGKGIIYSQYDQIAREFKDIAEKTLDEVTEFATESTQAQIWQITERGARLEGLLMSRGIYVNDGLKPDIFFCSNVEEVVLNCDTGSILQTNLCGSLRRS